jgi:hypothetical protein
MNVLFATERRSLFGKQRDIYSECLITAIDDYSQRQDIAMSRKALHHPFMVPKCRENIHDKPVPAIRVNHS